MIQLHEKGYLDLMDYPQKVERLLEVVTQKDQDELWPPGPSLPQRWTEGDLATAGPLLLRRLNVIVDSHAHAFPPMGGPAGHRSTLDHMRHIQHLLRFHHQPVRRVDDNSVFTSQTLYDGQDLSLDGLTEVNFRGGRNGKFLWTVDGSDYSIQYLPPTLTRLSAPPELMVAQMDYVGVERAVLQTGHTYGRLNSYLAQAARKFPDRFWALAMVDEWQIDRPSQIRTLDYAINNLGNL